MALVLWRTGRSLGSVQFRVGMTSIVPFTRPLGDFDDDTTRIMGEAFDAACHELRDQGQPAIVYEVIAKRILAAARSGERDAERLRDIGLAALQPNQIAG